MPALCSINRILSKPDPQFDEQQYSVQLTPDEAPARSSDQQFPRTGRFRRRFRAQKVTDGFFGVVP
jgi:hypothetical protein